MGSVSFGKYRLIAELGHGGMADVFLAVQAGPAGSGFRKLTVVKRLRQNLLDEPEFVAMLVDEATIAARLNHPNVVQTNEVGNVGNQYFIAMEYLDGQPLHRIQHRSMQAVKKGAPPPLSADQQYLILMDALHGLHHAHELADYDGTPLEIVHRDVTPQNIFVTYEGQVKVVDFGIAKAARRTTETRQGIVKGKVRYMAPEQAVGLPVSRRVDIFAVGIMLWEAALGRRMWKDHDDLQIVHALFSGKLPPMPLEVDATVPEEINRIIRKALAVKPEDRYATAEELRCEIEQYLASRGELVTTRRALPPMLVEMFKDKRENIRSIIESQLSLVEDVPSSELPIVPTDSSTSTRIPAMVASSGAVIEPSPHTLSSNLLSGTVEAPKKSRAVIYAGAAALVLVLVVGVGIRKTSGADALTTVEPPRTEEVSVRLSATPSEARVSVDGKPLESLPLDIVVPKDDRPHQVKLEADGYEPRVETLSFARDVQMAFELTRSPDPPPDRDAKHDPTTRPAPAVKPTWTPPHVSRTPTKPAETAPVEQATPDARPPTTPPATTTTHPAPAATGPSAPNPTTTGAAPVDVAAEHRKAVNRTIRTHASEVQACYDRARLPSPHVGGSITVAATLAPAGTVSSARVAKSTARSNVGNGAVLLESCLVDHFRSWAFPPPPPGASSDISYTFKFE